MSIDIKKYLGLAIIVGMALTACSFTDKTPDKSKATLSQLATHEYGNYFFALGIASVKGYTLPIKPPMRYYTFKDSQGKLVCNVAQVTVWPLPAVAGNPTKNLMFDLTFHPENQDINISVTKDKTVSSKEEKKGFYSFMENVADSCTDMILNDASQRKRAIDLDKIFNLRYDGLLEDMGVVSFKTLVVADTSGNKLIFQAQNKKGKVLGAISNLLNPEIAGVDKRQGQWHILLTDNKKISNEDIKKIFLSFSAMLDNLNLIKN